jgi:CRP-like cAMP-binding protein
MFIPGNTTLFEGLSEAEVTKLLGCMAYRHVSVRKGETVLREGERVDSIGLVLSGFVQIVRIEHDGQRIIQAGFGRGSIFAETFVCAGIVNIPVNVVASEDSDILFLPYTKLIGSCGNACAFHTRVISNLLKLLARKNLMLNGKISIVAKRTTREKVLAYLAEARQSAGSSTFEIPFDRNELADYLCVDRSALSRELGKMRDDGLLEFERNSFTILYN